MRYIKILIVCLFTLNCMIVSAQKTVCEVSYISTHIINNFTADTVYFTSDNLNQKSFPTKGSTMYLLPPYSATEVSSLEWSGTFKDPTIWYDMKFMKNPELPDPNKASNWEFEKSAETKGAYTLTISE